MNKTLILALITIIVVIAGVIYFVKRAPACKGSCGSMEGCSGNSTTRNQDLSFAGGYPTNYNYYSYHS